MESVDTEYLLNGAKNESRNTGDGIHSSRYSGKTISFHDINYQVCTSTGCCKEKAKRILKDISGMFKPGTMNAIMGPTGSGKSTLLDILAARKDPTGLSGTVLVDGQPQPLNFRLMSGYVVQDDVVMSTLTIRENLQFSADLRLPKGVSAKDRKAHVERVIEELSLGQCANTLIGNEFIRGVSGGERKRCNIGMELITCPSILFLDEPTTGLDASTAHTVMLLLKRLAISGSTVVFSIHQPRYSIFKLCDTVLLLGNGETIYQGPAFEGILFFKTLGYEIEEHDNPADFYLDIVIGAEPSAASEELTAGASSPMDIEHADPDARHAARCAFFSANYRESTWGQSVERHVKPILETFKRSTSDIMFRKNLFQLSYNSGFFTQFAVVCKRTFRNIMRNPRTGSMQLLLSAIFAVITGGIYFGLAQNCSHGIQDRVGAFFFIVMNQIFANLSAIDLFITERAIFMHENVSGYYRLSSYFFAKLFCDLLPFRTLPAIIYSAIVYWMMGLAPNIWSFLIFCLNLTLTAWSGTFIAFAASATARTQAMASMISALVFVFMMVFSGLLINVNFLRDWLKWLKYLSLFNYSMTVLQINEFSHVDFYEEQPIPGTNQTIRINCVKGNPASYMEKQGLSYATPWDLWQNVVALAAITLLFIIITYVQLRRIKKLR